MIATNSAYTVQHATLSMHEIAERLWQHGEHEAYRSLLAYAKERSAMLRELEELNRKETDQ